MEDDNTTNVELNTYSEPPTIITEDENGNTHAEIPTVEIKKLNLPYRKVVNYKRKKKNIYHINSAINYLIKRGSAMLGKLLHLSS